MERQGLPHRPKASETTPNWAASARRRAAFYFIAAVLLALLAALAAFAYLNELGQAALPTARAVVAVQDVEAGTLLQPGMVEVRSVPEAILPASSLGSVSSAVGRVVLVALVPREVVLPNMLSGQGGSLSARLPDGRYAMVLPAGWFVSPLPEMVAGDRVDLVAYRPGQPEAAVGFIVSGVEIVSVGGQQGSPDRLTVAVSLQEATAIFYSRANGINLMALLRPQGG